MRNFNKAKVILFIAVIIILIVTATFTIKYMHAIKRTAIPLLISLIIYYSIYPIVDFFLRHKLSRKAAVIITYAGLVLFVALIFTLLVPTVINDIRGILSSAPQMLESAETIVNNILSYLNKVGINKELNKAIIESMNKKIPQAEQTIKNIVENIPTGIKDAFIFFINFVLALVTAYYLISEREFFTQKIYSLVPRKSRSFIRKTLKDINMTLRNFFQGQLSIALMLAIVEIIGLTILNIRYSVLLGVIAGFSNLIPVLGPIFGMIPAVGIALLQSPVKALWTALLLIVVQQIEGSIITPKIMKKKVGLHPVTTIFVVLLGREIAGIGGMFIAVPLTAIIKATAINLIDEISEHNKKQNITKK